MSEEKKDLTTEELLKKLMENFGTEETMPEGTQLSIEDAAKDPEARKKVFRYRVGGKKEPEPAPEESDGDFSKELEESIRNAERFVEKMEGGKDAFAGQDGSALSAGPAEPGKTDADEENEDRDIPRETPREDDLPEDLSWLKLLQAEENAAKAEEELSAPENVAETSAEPNGADSESRFADGQIPGEAPAPDAAAQDPDEENGLTGQEGNEASALSLEAEEEPPSEDDTEERLHEILYGKDRTENGAPEEENADEDDDAALMAILSAPAWGTEEQEDAAYIPDSGNEEPSDDEAPALQREEGADEDVDVSPVEIAPDDFYTGGADASDEYAEEPAEEPDEEETLPDNGEGGQDPFIGKESFVRSAEEPAAPKEPGDEDDVLSLIRRKEVEENKEPENAEKAPDESEVNLMMIFDMEGDLEKRLGSDELKKVKRDIAGDAKAETVSEEYESPDQNARFFKRFKKSYVGVTARAWLAAAMCLITAVLEIIYGFVQRGGGSPAQFFRLPLLDTPVFTVLIAMQITMLLLAVAYREVITGVKAIFTGRPAPEIILALTGFFTIVYECGLLKFGGASVLFYNLPLAMAVTLSVFASKINLERRMLSFKIISTRKPKLAVTHKSEKETSKEQEAFGSFISGAGGIYGIEKTSFIKNSAKRNAKAPRFRSAIGILAMIVAAAGVIFFVLGYFFGKGSAKWLSAFECAMQAVLFTVPLSAFITFSLPFGRASKKAFKRDSAIIGEYSLEEYADATVISFDDKEVFPAKNVRVRSLKLYGDSRIDHVLFGAASVFHKLGGPLDEVFGAATRETGYTDDVDLLEIEQDGVEAAVKGARVYVGGSVFMRSRGLLPSVDPDDEAVEAEGRMSVMYLAIGEELSAKMYVEYKPDSEIREIMSSLYKAGMCIGIRTLDPNIDDEMLRSHVDLGLYPAKVLRMDKAGEKNETEPIDSGVVSKGKGKDLLRTLVSCRKVLQVIRAGTVFKFAGVLIGASLTATMLFTGMTGSVSSLWMAIYQLCVMIPVVIISLLFT